DTEGTTYAVIKEFTAGGEPLRVNLAKADKGAPIRLAPIMLDMPERLMLFIDAEGSVELEILGVETW
ncbi:MAG: hypothetical protein ACPL68_01690, partial [Candidatus Hydrothermia bacterium]